MTDKILAFPKKFKTPKEPKVKKDPKDEKDRILFIGCLPTSNDLPAQFPENGGRAPKFIQWYTKYIRKLSFKEGLILRDIIGDLNFNDFYTDFKEIREDTLADGSGMSLSSVKRAIKSLLEQGVLELEKRPENVNAYRLTRKLPDAYIAFLKERCPNKFSDTVVSQGHYEKERSVSLTPREVSACYHAKCQPDPTSCLNVPPKNHPTLINTYVDDRNDRDVKNKIDLSKMQKKSMEICQAIFNLEDRFRKATYIWMDNILSRHGEAAITYFEKLISTISDTGKYPPSAKNKKAMEENIKTTASDSFWEQIPDYSGYNSDPERI